MSLINDALRRADMEQRQRDAGAKPPVPPPLPPEETDTPAPKRRSPWTVLLGVALLVLVGGTAYGLWWGAGAIREKAGAAVESASAAFNQAIARNREAAGTARAAAARATLETATAAATRAATAKGGPAELSEAIPEGPTTPQTASDTAAGQPAAGQPAATEAGTGEPFHDDTGAILEAIRTGRLAEAGDALALPAGDAPALPLGGAPAAADFPDGVDPDSAAAAARLMQVAMRSGLGVPGGGDLEAPEMTDVFNQMLTMLRQTARTATAGSQTAAPPEGATRVAPSTAEAAPAEQTAPAGQGGKTSAANVAAKTSPDPDDPKTGEATSAPAAAPKAATAPPPALLPPVDTSHLKISSIMKGPKGGLAIINGRPVSEGESIAGAKVLRIGTRTVEVEIDGRQATVGM